MNLSLAGNFFEFSIMNLIDHINKKFYNYNFLYLEEICRENNLSFFRNTESPVT